jgi:surfeit locus 1 family protein
LKNLFLFNIFVFLFITLFCSLGTWQLYRLQWKQNLISQISEGLKSNSIQYSKNIKKNYQKVNLVGEYNFKNQIYLYSLNTKGQPGFDVVTPFQTVNKENVLVNRGWIKKELKNDPKINYSTKNITGMLRIANRKNIFTPDKPRGFTKNYR